MDAEEKLIQNGFEGIKFLTDFSYDTALIGVTHDDRTVYDFDKETFEYVSVLEKENFEKITYSECECG